MTCICSEDPPKSVQGKQKERETSSWYQVPLSVVWVCVKASSHRELATVNPKKEVVKTLAYWDDLGSGLASQAEYLSGNAVSHLSLSAR